MAKSTRGKIWHNELPKAVKSYVGRRKIEEVECMTPDFVGTSRGKTILDHRFAPTVHINLPISVFYQTISGEYVDLDLESQWVEQDIRLVPDMDTASAVPWSDSPNIQVICDAIDRQGAPVDLSPRAVLKRVDAMYAQRGWQPIVAPELEFFLTQPNLDPNHPIAAPVGRTGRPHLNRQVYSMAAVDEYGPVIDTIYEYAEAQGLSIESVMQEDGASQLEINLQHGKPVDLADRVFYFKRAIREAAHRHGIFATFMAKPMRDQPGSAMHLHQSVVDIATGKNIFSDKHGNPTKEFKYFIGGLQHNLRSVCPILAPYVNSYRRFVRYPSATSINIEWGEDNRTTGIRVPSSSPEARRVENRIIGMDCNPYLAIATSLACGLQGIISQTEPYPMVTSAVEVISPELELPSSLAASLELFAQASDIRAMLGEHFCQVYEAIKHSENNEYQREITPWERQYLLLNA